MNEPSPPTRILLATDLSARCDRALDRAAQLAKAWGAELVVLNVIEPAAMPDQALAWAAGARDDDAYIAARRQLDHALAGLGIHAEIQLAHGGDPAAVIRATAERLGASLVVTGVASDEILGGLWLGSTVERLARTLCQPLLIVRERVVGPYHHIAVATDFSDCSRHAFETSVWLFPEHKHTLYHAYETPLDGLADNVQNDRIRRNIEQGECAEFIAAGGWPPQALGRSVIECGAVETMLAQYARRNDIDLVVMGTHGRSGILDILLGSTAARLLDWLPCDTLLVPTAYARMRSAGEPVC